MKNISLIFLLTIATYHATAQLPQTVKVNGILRTVEGAIYSVPNKNKYKKLTDSLDKNLKASPTDTTSLFYRSLIYYTYNQMLAEPYQRTKGTLENLTIAKNMIEKAISNNMQDFRAKLLRAQIYSELSFRFTGDESWMFTPSQIDSRRKLFNTYKHKANELYAELGRQDPRNEYDYSKKKISHNYPIK